MTRLGELQLEQSRIKMKGNALLNKEDRYGIEETTELREATVASEKIEIEIQAALVLEDEADKNARETSLDPEALELRQLTDRSNLGIDPRRSRRKALYRWSRSRASTAPRTSGESVSPRIAEVAAGRTGLDARSDKRRGRAGCHRATRFCGFGGRSPWHLSTHGRYGRRGFSDLDFAAVRPGTVLRRKRRGRDNGRFRFRALGSLAITGFVSLEADGRGAFYPRWTRRSGWRSTRAWRRRPIKRSSTARKVC